MCAAGSTPRMWGKVLIKFSECDSRGSTPRMWGKDSQSFISRRMGGSTPRVWGKARTFRNRNSNTRFNPTHVGKSSRGLETDISKTVQPHACGEKNRFLTFRFVELGSTPRMWGKDCENPFLFVRSRFNPTHVGKSVRIAGYEII